ncbi:protein of unknown function [Azospirillum baldaniorum]|uniref:Uncharacterized protein n=1 Tax=Azospirillum baldaniorum TaxID=1064539 RepID=A0A9P1JNC2_9PROT|nr:protein of unknown function [Azospirillum baldaniorum]
MDIARGHKPLYMERNAKLRSKLT